MTEHATEYSASPLLMKNILFWALIGTYALLYVIGTLVAYSKKDLFLFAGSIGGACMIGGIHFGMWSA